MKKLLIVFGAASLLLMTGCQKETILNEYKPLKARISLPDDEMTKTELSGHTLTWVKDDNIYVIAPNQGTPLWGLHQFQIVNDADITSGGKVATFTDQSGEDWSSATFYLAFYGKKGGYKFYSGINLQGVSPTGSNNYVEIYNGCMQTYTTGGPNPLYLMMGIDATTTLDNISFKNMMSILKIPVKSTDETHTLSSIKVVCDDDPISGAHGAFTHTPRNPLTAFAKLSSHKPTGTNKSSYPVITDNTPSGGTYGNWVMLNDINEVLNGTAKYFYLVVWPSTHSSMTVTLTDTAEPANTKVFNWSTSITFEEGVIYNFPEINWN